MECSNFDVHYSYLGNVVTLFFFPFLFFSSYPC
jgi:hypothetical protein